MNAKRYLLLIYIIIATIIVTIGIQFYWNYTNYQSNKQRVLNEIQLSLDNAVEEYFATIAKDNFTTIINVGENTKVTSSTKIVFDSVLKNTLKNTVKSKNLKKDTTKNTSEINISSIEMITDKTLTKHKSDSIFKDIQASFHIKDSIKEQKTINFKPTEVKIFKGVRAADSLKLLKSLKPIFISITSNAIDYKSLDSLVQEQLITKSIPIKFKIEHQRKDSLLFTSKKENLDTLQILEVKAKSTFIKRDEQLKLQFNNPIKQALQRSSFGIFLSLLLSAIIISCLFYLLKVIKNQKELANIKNDLISNITHEFKTPIATISTAIEAINNFDVLKDQEKTKKYLSISNQQLSKLHLMVEKLLETATLNSNQLILKPEKVDLVDLIDKVIKKYSITNHKKKIDYKHFTESLPMQIDAFHIENVISNLLDNALKYGGKNIEIHLKLASKNTIQIQIVDDGLEIEKMHQTKIFDQFYRIPKGNTHDIKGFGIGLYYAKVILEKHEGNISLESNKQKTTFTITLPYEKN